jgi:hypothetical protein
VLSNRSSHHNEGSFFCVFMGQLILLVLTIVGAIFVGIIFGLSIPLLGALLFVALAVLSILGPALTTASELTIGPTGIEAKKYFGRTWSCSWSEVTCVLVFESHAFGSRYRVKICAASASSVVVSDLASDFSGFLDQLERFVPEAPPCAHSILNRVLSG